MAPRLQSTSLKFKIFNFIFLYFSGVAPPNQRSESQFDAGSKYHVAANSGYVQVPFILSWHISDIKLKLLLFINWSNLQKDKIFSIKKPLLLAKVEFLFVGST